MEEISPLSIPALILVLLGSGSGPESEPDESIAVTEVAAQPPATSLAEVRLHPLRWLGREFRTVIQYDGPRQNSSYLTDFSPSTYWSFGAWGDEQRLWVREDYHDPALRLFARRNTAPAVFLGAASHYERFEVKALVREVLFGEPWIEVLEVHRIPDSWNEGALVHATRADVLMASGRWLIAAEQYDRALAGRLPTAARAGMEELRDRCRAHHARREQTRRRGNASYGLIR